MAKVARRFLLDEEAVRRAELYRRHHRTSLSAMVNEYFRSLPVQTKSAERFNEDDLSPAVRRLLGVAAPAVGIENYREYLAGKYG